MQASCTHAWVVTSCAAIKVAAQLAMTLGTKIELWHTQSLVLNAYILAKDSRGQKKNL